MIRLRKAWLIELIPLLAIGMRMASAPTANLSFLLLAAYALLGRKEAIKALALSWLFTMINPGMAAQASAASVGRYAVLAAAAASVLLRSGFLRNHTRVTAPTLATLLLGCLIVVHSLMFSPMADVSALKAVSWTIAASTIFSAWASLSPIDRDTLARQMFGGLVALLIVSLPLLGLGLGYLRNERGFQGVLAHPQAFGPAMALLGAWCGSRLLSTRRPSWGAAVLFGACLTLVVLSQARTAGVALILGLVLAGIIAPMLAREPIRALLPGLRSPRLHLLLGLSLMAALFAVPMLTASLGTYVAKSSDSSSLASAYEDSRGNLIRQMTENIAEQPMTGIGFGIASIPGDMVVERDSVLGLPTGAAVEKGVLPIAVLEELGIPGLLFVVVWLFMLVRRATRGGVTPLSVFLVALLMNMGESVLFSPGGMGLLSLILIGWAIAERREGEVGARD